MGWRNDQCKKVCRIIDNFFANRPTERDSLILAVQKAFDALEKQQWIPVEERLPEPWTLVLVTDSCKNVSVCQWSWGDNNWYDEYENWLYFHDSVVAWMPLPEPYKGEQE